MALSYPLGAVTQGKWGVGGVSGDGYPPGGELHVYQFFQHRSPWLMRKGDHDGRPFATQAERERFTREHGYVRPYLPYYATFRKTHREQIREVHDGFVFCLAAVDQDGLRKLVDDCKRTIGELSGDVLVGCHFAAGYWHAARRLRPDLFEADGFWPKHGGGDA